MKIFMSFFSFEIMEKNEFNNESPKKDGFFIFTLVILLVFCGMAIGTDFDQFSQHKSLNIPSWYFYIIFSVDVLMILSLVFIYFYRKPGVYLYPAFVLAHLICHVYYLDTLLYTDVTNLFAFVGFGLFAIIPKWQFFK